MFENPRRGRQERNFTTNNPKILDLKSFSEQIFSRKLPLGAPESSAGFFLSFSTVIFRSGTRAVMISDRDRIQALRIYNMVSSSPTLIPRVFSDEKVV